MPKVRNWQGEQRKGDWRAIDDRTGFKVFASELRKEWDNLMCVEPDRRNPQDYVRGVPDRQTVPFARPSPPDVFLSAQVLPEDL